MEPNHLYYVNNELRGGIPSMLPAPPAQASSELVLDYGWLVEDTQVLVEHKTVEDLAQSLRSGHLADQLERGKAVTDHVYLCVTGLACPEVPGGMGLCAVDEYGSYLAETTMSTPSGNWDYDRFQDALISILHGLQVGGPIVGLTKSATARNIMALYRQTRREGLGKDRPKLPKWKQTKVYDQVEAYSRAFPGIGWEKARALAAEFPTWYELVQFGTRERLQMLSGFGRVLSSRLHAMIMGGKYA